MCCSPAPLPGRTRVRPVIAAIGTVGAISGIGAWSIGLAGIRLVDPHLSPARDAHWQTGAYTNGKRINSTGGSPAPAALTRDRANPKAPHRHPGGALGLLASWRTTHPRSSRRPLDTVDPSTSGGTVEAKY